MTEATELCSSVFAWPQNVTFFSDADVLLAMLVISVEAVMVHRVSG